MQYSTNFSTKPDLIIHPLIDFAGRAELPFIIDVTLNSSAIYQWDAK